MSKNMGIYKITNIGNGKLYIGSSNNLQKRKREHFWALRYNKHNNPYMQNAYNKYGEKSFTFEIIEAVNNSKELLEKEQSYIDLFNVCDREIGYNINEYSSGGGLKGEKNPNYGKKMSEEQKEKIRKALMGHFVSEETKKKMKLNKKNIIKGEKHYLFGKTLSEERRKQQSEKLKSRYVGEKNPFYNKKHSDTTKQIMSIKKKGKKGELCPNSIKIVQLTKKFVLVSEHSSMQEAQRNTKVYASNIQKCCIGKLKSSGGFKWMYYEDYLKTL